MAAWEAAYASSAACSTAAIAASSASTVVVGADVVDDVVATSVVGASPGSDVDVGGSVTTGSTVGRGGPSLTPEHPANTTKTNAIRPRRIAEPYQSGRLGALGMESLLIPRQWATNVAKRNAEPRGPGPAPAGTQVGKPGTPSSSRTPALFKNPETRR